MHLPDVEATVAIGVDVLFDHVSPGEPDDHVGSPIGIVIVASSPQLPGVVEHLDPIEAAIAVTIDDPAHQVAGLPDAYRLRATVPVGIQAFGRWILRITEDGVHGEGRIGASRHRIAPIARALPIVRRNGVVVVMGPGRMMPMVGVRVIARLVVRAVWMMVIVRPVARGMRRGFSMAGHEPTNPEQRHDMRFHRDRLFLTGRLSLPITLTSPSAAQNAPPTTWAVSTATERKRSLTSATGGRELRLTCAGREAAAPSPVSSSLPQAARMQGITRSRGARRMQLRMVGL